MDDKKLVVNIVAGNETILCGGMYPAEPRLTPTGKISRAKTRVYTQRYRKDWEQMPDFKGWLTPVRDQPTRAYCTYCKKNLHAHRLSLLKHTCTMKHQRAALMHQNEMKNAIEGSDVAGSFEEVNIEMDRKDIAREYEENEEFEYVVETLDMEEDELNDADGKAQHIDSTEDYEEDTNLNVSIDQDHETPNKKIKIERDDESCHDTLAEAMAHVHDDDYLESTEEQVNVQMEMVVGEDEAAHETENDVSLHSIEDEIDEPQNNDEIKRSTSADKSSPEEDSSEPGSESEISPAHRLEDTDKSFKSLKEALSSSKLDVSFGTPISIPAGQIKTIRLDSGKTVTLRAGTQYILSNIKGNQLPSLLLAKKKKDGQSDAKSAQSLPKSTQKKNYLSVASTSKQSLQTLTKGAGSKKPCISTHVLDMTKGLPIGGLQVSLYKLMDGRWTFLNESFTSANGRCDDLVDNLKINITVGRYKIHFDVDKYFTLRRIETMYPFIEIVFDVKNPTGNYHIPILLSPFGYTTYRGSDR